MSCVSLGLKITKVKKTFFDFFIVGILHLPLGTKVHVHVGLHVLMRRIGNKTQQVCVILSDATICEVSGMELGEGGLSRQTLDHGQYFLNEISTWHLLYTAIHNYLKVYYLH